MQEVLTFVLFYRDHLLLFPLTRLLNVLLLSFDMSIDINRSVFQSLFR